MLSRIAESLYWIGRYVERAEDTSRILDVYLQLLVEDPSVDTQLSTATLYAVRQGAAWITLNRPEQRNALSAALVFGLPARAGWQGAWWLAAGCTAALSVAAWFIRPATTASEVKAHADQRKTTRRPFALLFGSYTLEGIGYIIAGTFLVAAIAQHSPGRLGTAAWLVVGLAAIPSAALWARLSSRFSHPVLLTGALLLQAGGIGLACTGSGVAAVLGAVLFGGTFIGISTLALAAGRQLQFPGAVALLTAGYSVGQILGPVAVSPLVHNGFRAALGVGAVVVLLAAVTAIAIRVVGGQPDSLVADTQVPDVAGERVDHGPDGRTVLVAAPDQ